MAAARDVPFLLDSNNIAYAFSNSCSIITKMQMIENIIKKMQNPSAATTFWIRIVYIRTVYHFSNPSPRLCEICHEIKALKAVISSKFRSVLRNKVVSSNLPYLFATLSRLVTTLKNEDFWKTWWEKEKMLVIPKRSFVFTLHLFCRLQLLSIWTSLNICRLVKSYANQRTERPTTFIVLYPITCVFTTRCQHF